MSSQMKRFCAVCIGVLFFLCLQGAGWADTNVSGAVSANTAWNSAGNPYTVPGIVTVNAGAAQISETGVCMK